MQITETKEILRRVALIDNRKVTPEVIEAWHQVIGGLSLNVAIEALKLAQQDGSIKYLEPRHIYTWSKEASFRLGRNTPGPDPKYVATPQPTCTHGKPVLSCNPCCSAASKQMHRTDADLLVWAKQNIYA